MQEKLIDNLYEVFTKIETKEQARLLLEDLCTYAEIDKMAQRLEAARLLMDNHTYSEVIAMTDISSATLSRVSKCVQHGAGGYRYFIQPKNKK